MSARAAVAIVVPLVLAVLSGVRAQEGEITVRLVSPGPETYLSGPVLLKAIVEPPPRAREAARVLFYADGRLVCTLVDAARAECPWDAGAEVKEHLVRVVVDLKDGKRAVAATRTKGLQHTETVTVDVVQVTAVVNDGNRFVKGLSKDAFRITEDGVPQTISHFSNEGSPLELVVAVDVSQSMAPNMPQLKNAVRKFLAALGPKDQVTLAAFNDQLFTLARRETVAAQRLRAVDRLAPWGGTALFDVIVRGVQLLSRAPGRRVLVVFSDGDDRTSHATIANVEAAMRSTDSTLFMVALGRGAKEAQLRSGIQRLITLSGGRGLFVEKSENLEDAFADIVVELSNQYLMGYQSTNAKRDGAWREIAIDVPGSGHTVRARQGYRAPGGQ
jgi:Ca-activated chloride channel family protein